MTRRQRGVLVAVAGIATVIAAMLITRVDRGDSLASRVVRDCRDRLRSEADLKSPVEWRPGPGTLIRHPDGTYSTVAELRMADSRGRIIGISARCSYTPTPDSSFAHYSTFIEQSVVQRPGVADERRGDLWR